MSDQLSQTTDSASLRKPVAFENGIFSLDLSVLGKLSVNKGLTVSGETEFKGHSIFQSLVDFIGNVIFKGDITFLGRPTFNKDTAGFAIIKKGQKYVGVSFEREYETKPVVTASILLPKLDDNLFKILVGENFCTEHEGKDVCQEKLAGSLLNGNNQYIITNQDKKGFALQIEKPAPFDISFSWLALAVKDSTISTNDVPSDLHMPFAGNIKVTNKFGEQATEPEILAQDLKLGLQGHDGVDFAMNTGNPIFAIDDGEVIPKSIGVDQYGTTIVIQHSWGKSFYGHLSEVYVKDGQKVTKGDKIALSGNTGLSTGAHLHFGIRLNKFDQNNGYFGKVDPLHYLNLELTSISNISAEKILTMITPAQSSSPTIIPNLTSIISNTPSPTLTPTTIPEASSGALLNPERTVSINSIELGFLRVRDEPKSASNEIGQVNPGDKFTILDGRDGWYKIEYEPTKFGWIRETYTTLIERSRSDSR